MTALLLTNLNFASRPDCGILEVIDFVYVGAETRQTVNIHKQTVFLDVQVTTEMLDFHISYHRAQQACRQAVFLSFGCSQHEITDICVCKVK